jgi:hypothetical protein
MSQSRIPNRNLKIVYNKGRYPDNTIEDILFRSLIENITAGLHIRKFTTKMKANNTFQTAYNSWEYLYEK